MGTGSECSGCAGSPAERRVNGLMGLPIAERAPNGGIVSPIGESMSDGWHAGHTTAQIPLPGPGMGGEILTGLTGIVRPLGELGGVPSLDVAIQAPVDTLDCACRDTEEIVRVPAFTTKVKGVGLSEKSAKEDAEREAENECGRRALAATAHLCVNRQCVTPGWWSSRADKPCIKRVVWADRPGYQYAFDCKSTLVAHVSRVPVYPIPLPPVPVDVDVNSWVCWMTITVPECKVKVTCKCPGKRTATPSGLC
jgi:hypothetical protein